MNTVRVIVVHLRQPERGSPNESRDDPFYEFGSFGCTECHSRNLMHPARAHELEGARFAFAQGGPLGTRLVHLTPPVHVVAHKNLCEVVWTPAERPFRYDAAPVLVNAAGESDLPALRATLDGVNRASWPACFSSRFRSRRRPLPVVVAEELARVFDRKRAKATPEQIARSYVDALPYAPNRPDPRRSETLARLRARANGRPSKESCVAARRCRSGTTDAKKKTAP